LPPQEQTTTFDRRAASVDLALPAHDDRLPLLQRLVLDGTATMMGGTLIAGITTYAWQAGGTRTLGKTAFAPVANTWTLYFLVVTILLVPIEQFATRTVAAGEDGEAHLAKALSTIATLLLVASIAIAACAYLLRASLFDDTPGYALVACAVVLSLGQLALCRGILVGRRRFGAYGWITGLDSVIRLLVGLPLVLVTRSPLALVWTIPLSSLVALAWIREWPLEKRSGTRSSTDTSRGLERGVPIKQFLATTVGGTSAAQVLLAGGPLLLAIMGASGSAVTVLFVTQTACRAAFLMATPAGARSLPPLTRIALSADYRRLGDIAVRLSVGALVCAAVLGSASLIVTPPLIAAVFGSSVRPSALVACTMAAGTVLAIGNLGLNQILVAAARTHRITAAWWIAVGAATVWALGAPGSPLQRVSTSFVLGELVALLALMFASSIRLSKRAASQPTLGTPVWPGQETTV
jgi:O-antigen/teichoic acid export membrane protein